MPIYEYRCTACKARVEVLVRSQTATPSCPERGDYPVDEEEADKDWWTTKAFSRWRNDSEEAGCLTPLGGTAMGGSVDLD